jgi:paired amphipathic helix protein Sin3a
VTLLFKNAPDLLDEFKQFLPENGNPPNPDLFDEMMPQPSTPAPPPRSMPTLNTLSNGMAGMLHATVLFVSMFVCVMT